MDDFTVARQGQFQPLLRGQSGLARARMPLRSELKDKPPQSWCTLDGDCGCALSQLSAEAV
eukprot:946911-Rhodomonas_salina.4